MVDILQFSGKDLKTSVMKCYKQLQVPLKKNEKKENLCQAKKSQEELSKKYRTGEHNSSKNPTGWAQ
jgi:hypothetical protein